MCISRNVQIERMYGGYPQAAPVPPDMYAQPPYARLPQQPGVPFPAPPEVVVKTESDSSVTQGYYPNGGFPVITDALKPHPYYSQPQYTTSVYSAAGTISSNGYESAQALGPPPSYDQYRITPPTSKDSGYDQNGDNNGHVFWNTDNQQNDAFENEQPSKRARYSSEDFST